MLDAIKHTPNWRVFMSKTTWNSTKGNELCFELDHTSRNLCSLSHIASAPLIEVRGGWEFEAAFNHSAPNQLCTHGATKNGLLLLNMPVGVEIVMYPLVAPAGTVEVRKVS